MTHNQTNKGECCPVFDPEPWDGKTWEWLDKLYPQIFTNKNTK